MTSEVTKRRPRQPLWDRIAGHAVAALLITAAAVLSIGGAPAWAEWIAAAFLWAILSLVYVSFGIGLLVTLIPVSPQLQQHHERSRKPRRRRGWVGWSARRLLQLLFVAALAVSGRLVLAGLYLFVPVLIAVFEVSFERAMSGVDRPEVSAGKWVVYRGMRFILRMVHQVLRLLVCVLRWLIWVPLVAAVAACLFHADIRLKRPLRRALGLPQAIAHVLYAPPYRRLWQKALPAVFWLAATTLALWLSLASPAAPAAGAIAALLGSTAVVLLLLGALSLLVLLWPDIESSIAHRPRPAGWPRTPGPYFTGLLRLVLLGALCWVGAWGLAGLYLALICVMAAVALVLELEERTGPQEVPDTNIFPPVAGLIGIVLVVSLFVLAASPVVVPYLAFHSLSDMRTARRLREAHARPDGLIYFLYAEPHQREHFLGEGGLLHAWRDRVVARDWRSEVRAAESDLGWAGFMETAEGRLLERFEVTNKRADLPFLAVITGRRLKAFRLGEAYRARRRDGGKALGDLERRIGKRLAKSFAGGPS